MRLSTSTPTSSRTDCRWVEIGDVSLFFSYQTCIAVSYAGLRARRKNTWGPTTGKHIRMAEICHWPESDNEEEFAQTVRGAFMQAGLALFETELRGQQSSLRMAA